MTATSGSLKKECVITVEEKYYYKLKPMLEPFADYFYLNTDDPDPYDLEFVDENTAYEKDDQAIIKPDDTQYIDVKYTNVKMRQVNNHGYICQSDTDGGVTSNGGKLIMKRKVIKNGTESKACNVEIDDNDHSNKIKCPSGTYLNTNVTVSLPTLKTDDQYLIDTYTNENQSFFEKMDAVQSALDQLAVYPRSICNTSKPTGYYGSLDIPVYGTGYLNEHYENIYRLYSDDDMFLLSQKIYPYAYDSNNFPGMMRDVAMDLASDCKFDDGYNHSIIEVTKDGKTKSYGGQGYGTTDPMLDTHIKNYFRFDGSSEDYYDQLTLDKLNTLLINYANYAKQDWASYPDLLYGKTFKQKIGKGTWIRVGAEGYNIDDHAFVYEMKYASWKSPSLLTNTWVDGRYVTNYGNFYNGYTFKDHNTAKIALLNQTITDKYGNKHEDNMLFYYREKYDAWIALDSYEYYYGVYSEDDIDFDSLPDEYVLTQDEVKKMNQDPETALDCNTNKDPEHGLIYDGSAQPGTPF